MATNRFLGHLVVAGFVERDGKLLVIRERVPHDDPDAPIVMNQPAGHVETKETFSQAVVREVLEETGYNVKPIDLVGIYQKVTEDATIVYASFRCELTDPEQHPIEAPEIIETLWLTEEEVMARQDEHRSSTTTSRFKDFFAGKQLPLETITQFDWN